MEGRENTLLLRCRLWEAELEDRDPGAKLGRPAPAPWKTLLETERLTDESPGSAPNPTDEDRKFGCWGRPPEFISDIERVCCEVKGGF